MAATAILSFCIIFCGIIFFRNYHYLSDSIQEERVEAVSQIGKLVSKKITMLSDNHGKEVRLTAKALQATGTTTFEQTRALLGDDGRILFLSQTGKFLSIKGETVPLDDKDFLRRLRAGEDEIITTFVTIPSKGEYWLFGVPVDFLTLDGQKIVALIIGTSEEEYAAAATISLYGGYGFSFVTDHNGSILMRSSNRGSGDFLQGYNLLKILEKKGVPEKDIRTLEEAIKGEQEAQIVEHIDGTLWLLQCISGDKGRNIIIVVPISLTAKSTFDEMTQLLLFGLGLFLSFSLLFILWFVHFTKEKQAIAEENAKTMAKSDFMSKMSHDIRTPLNGILGMQELALESIDDQAFVLDCLTKAQSSGIYLRTLINDVIDMSRIENGKMTTRKEPFSLSDMMDHVIMMELNHAQQHDLTLKHVTSGISDSNFIGDSIHLEQCLMNLLSNAIKFTPSGGTVTISCIADPPDGRFRDVLFQVSDNGIGMSDEYLKKMFTPFEQEQSSYTSGEPGSGLGLAIVKNLVSLMGGTIEVQSKQNAGSLFSIHLRMETVAKQAEKKTDDLRSMRFEGKRILVAEDNELNSIVITRMLEHRGCAVDEAVNGVEALEKFTSSPKGTYALILMDLMMPVMGGLEATRRIRSSGYSDSKTIPIIALSANAFEEDRITSIEAGMQEHLSKPIDKDQLDNILRKYIS